MVILMGSISFQLLNIYSGKYVAENSLVKNWKVFWNILSVTLKNKEDVILVVHSTINYT